MDLKQFLVQKLSLFFMLTTLITLVICAFGLYLDADAQFGYNELLTPVRIAALCVIPTLVTYSRHELTPRQMKARMALELALIEAVVLALAFTSPAIDTDRASVVAAIAGSVLGIYVLARLFSWLHDSAQARELNAELARFQQLFEE
ncbi:Uncharacterised protein [Slackia heliotrinireducens]|uniref:Uncharacterized protein n=1 Tax=Slackia heliotrinireducens (strain ATCC 29202 / DSM 20476 / NCTC 11029 / RHS 1) TaxID=471855 RepID=C7N705_SLAHD|nr:hypothetical protein [Slackia heliotrinireducens]ACV22690.1 hypothetical protein Shel_16710 [Slackia heliotrinireducens DSM 20476]VEH01286.1 Uncharacterised protein [Slackia heliotrinireducens]